MPQYAKEEQVCFGKGEAGRQVSADTSQSLPSVWVPRPIEKP